MTSSVKCTEIGVSQGSILGTLLFTICVNDMCNLSTHFSYIQFADDTTLLMSGPDVSDLLRRANNELYHFM